MTHIETQLFLGGLTYYRKFKSLKDSFYDGSSLHDLIYEYSDIIGYDLEEEEVDMLTDVLSNEDEEFIY